MDEGLFSVDKFTGGNRVYFLTHLHQDHTRGLGAAGGWRHGPLYCSPVTARLLPTRFPGIDASLLRPIAAGESASLTLSSPTSGRLFSLHVTAIPALHCPGSLMYLFRGDLGCMLFTGDFRWELGCEEARSAKKALLQALAGDSVDVLYMDNTYCHPTLNFPPRRVVAEQIWICCIIKVSQNTVVLKTPRRRIIKISASTLCRSRVIMKRKGTSGARLEGPEEPISVP